MYSVLFLTGLPRGQSHWSTVYFIQENSTKSVKMRSLYSRDWKLLKMPIRKKLWAKLVVVLDRIHHYHQLMMVPGLKTPTVLWGANRTNKLVHRTQEILLVLVGDTKDMVAVEITTGALEFQKNLCGYRSLISCQSCPCYLYVKLLYIETYIIIFSFGI